MKTLIVAFFSLALATVSHAETIGTSNGVQNPPPQGSATLDKNQLSASVYYEPIKDGEVRDPELLKPLHFEPVIKSQAEFQKILQGQWRMLFHCGGSPMTAKDLASHRFLDGWINEQGEFLFDGQKFSRDTYPPLSTWKSKGVTDLARTPDQTKGTFKVDSLGGGNFVTTYSDDIFIPDHMRLNRIKETGEYVIDYDEDAQSPQCKPGVNVRVLLVNLALTS